MIMKELIVRFYEELNDFLPAEMRKQDITVMLKGEIRIGELISLFDVPHEACDLVLCDGKSVDFDYVPGNNSRISVYPVFESFDISSISRLNNRPIRKIRFLTDSDLYMLTLSLRMLGFDTFYADGMDDLEILKKANEDNRIILTKRKSFIKKYRPHKALYLRSNNIEKQILFLIERLNLQSIIKLS